MLCLSAKRFSFMKSKPRPHGRRGLKTPEQALSVRKGVARQIRAKFSFQVLLPMKLYWIWLQKRGVFLGALLGGCDRLEKRGRVSAFRRLLKAPPPFRSGRASDLTLFFLSSNIFGEIEEREREGENNERNKHRDTRNKRKRKASFCS